MRKVYNFVVQILLLTLSLSVLAGCPSIKDATHTNQELNEKSAINLVHNIVSNQATSYSNDQRFADADELEIKSRQVKGYVVEMKVENDTFQIWATPLNYPEDGKLSFYSDNKVEDILGEDIQGKKANNNSPIVRSIANNLKETFNK